MWVSGPWAKVLSTLALSRLLRERELFSEQRPKATGQCCDQQQPRGGSLKESSRAAALLLKQQS